MEGYVVVCGLSSDKNSAKTKNGLSEVLCSGSQIQAMDPISDQGGEGHDCARTLLTTDAHIQIPRHIHPRHLLCPSYMPFSRCIARPSICCN